MSAWQGLAWTGAGLVGLVVCIGAAVLSPAAVVRDGVAHIALAGRIQLLLLRTLIPLVGGVNRSVGLEKRAVAMTRLTIATAHGPCPVTIYRPPGAAGQTLPLHINFHGGGFVVGFPEQDDLICRHLALEVPCAVANVDYALAPEHPYPAALLQSYAVVEALAERAVALDIDPLRLSVGGFSAGGAIAAVVARLARDQARVEIRLQILAYPGLDFASDYRIPEPSEGPPSVLTPAMLKFFADLYLPQLADRILPGASPVLLEALEGLPPVLLLTADRDLVRPGGERYARNLTAAGVEVTHHDFAGCDHGFTHAGPRDPARTAIATMIDALQRAYSGETPPRPFSDRIAAAQPRLHN